MKMKLSAAAVCLGIYGAGTWAISIDGVQPSNLIAGQSTVVTVSGCGFAENGAAQLLGMSGGVAVSNVQWLDIEQVSITVTVDETASEGSRTLRWVNPDSAETAILPAAFTISAVPDEEYVFTDVAGALGVTDRDRGAFGVTFVDFDGDGWDDLYTANGEDPEDHNPEDFNVLYRNNGDGTFTNVTDETGVDDSFTAMRNVWADFDHDGDRDLYSHNFRGSTLYRSNLESGVDLFTDIGDESGTRLDYPRGTGSVWCDIDQDGYVDLHNVQFPTGENVLFINNQDGTFSDQTAAWGLPATMSWMGNSCVDIDNDSDLDLIGAFVTAEDPNMLWLNDGNGQFIAATEAAGLIAEAGASGASITPGDYNNDGLLDLLYTEVRLGSQKDSDMPLRIYLYENNGDGTFTDVSLQTGLVVPLDNGFGLPSGATGGTWHASWADYNNDTHLDLFIGSDGPDALYRNNGDGTFTDVAPQMGMNLDPVGKGGAWSDYDQDGDLDLYALRQDRVGFASNDNNLWQNSGGTNNWLQVEVRGTCVNPDAIGAVVTVTGTEGTQTRWVEGGTGFFDQHSFIQHFGLGEMEQVRVAVKWPGDRRFTGSATFTANQRIVITEPDTCLTQSATGKQR